MNLRSLVLASLMPLAAALPVSAQLVVSFDDLGSGATLTQVSPSYAGDFSDLDASGVIFLLDEGAHTIFSGAPDYDNPVGVTPAPVGGSIHSVLLHYSPAQGNLITGGTITFDRAILGLYTTAATLDGTDAGYGSGLIDYAPIQGNDARGLDGFPDVAIIDSNTLDLSVIFANSSATNVDQVRVILVPEPSTYALALGVIVLGIVGVRRVRQSRTQPV